MKESLMRRRLASLGIITLAFAAGCDALQAQLDPELAQAVSRVTAQLEPEIRRAMLDGTIPSIAIAITDRDGELWSAAFGESNLWAGTPASTQSVYLIGSTFKAQSTVALMQQMEQANSTSTTPFTTTSTA